MRMVVTFDFDDTLLELAVKRDADGDIVNVHVTNREKNPRTWPRFLKFLGAGYDVHIVTSRNENGKKGRANVEYFLRKWGVLDRLAGVHFTNGKLKKDTLAMLGSYIHHDDDVKELSNLPDGCEGWKASIHPSWKTK